MTYYFLYNAYLIAFWLTSISALALATLTIVDLITPRMKSIGGWRSGLFSSVGDFPKRTRTLISLGFVTVVAILYILLLVEASAPWLTYKIDIRDVRIERGQTEKNMSYLMVEFVITNSGPRAFDGYISLYAKESAAARAVPVWPSLKGQRVVVAYSLSLSVRMAETKTKFGEVWLNIYKHSGGVLKSIKLSGGSRGGT